MIERFKLWLLNWLLRDLSTTSNLVEHAKREMELAGCLGNDIGEMFYHGTVQLMQLFSTQGHSGGSAPSAVELFSVLARYEVLTPLTGADDEWNDISEGCSEPTWQNRRCSRVFKSADGGAYDIGGRVFEDETGRFCSSESRVPVTFPYTPTQEVVKV